MLFLILDVAIKWRYGERNFKAVKARGPYAVGSKLTHVLEDEHEVIIYYPMDKADRDPKLMMEWIPRETVDYLIKGLFDARMWMQNTSWRRPDNMIYHWRN